MLNLLVKNLILLLRFHQLLKMMHLLQLLLHHLHHQHCFLDLDFLNLQDFLVRD
jgi:hypothetical protein